MGSVAINLTAPAEAQPGQNVIVYAAAYRMSQCNSTAIVNATLRFSYLEKSLGNYSLVSSALDCTGIKPTSFSFIVGGEASPPQWVIAILGVTDGDSTYEAAVNLVKITSRSYDDLYTAYQLLQSTYSKLLADYSKLQGRVTDLNTKFAELSSSYDQLKSGYSYATIALSATTVAGFAATGVVILLLIRKRRAARTEQALVSTQVTRKSMNYSLGLLSDTGKMRTNNEDAVLAIQAVSTFESVGRSSVLCAVADGVGGSNKGEIASRLTLQTLVARASDILLGQSTDNIQGAFKSAIEAANEAVVKHATAHPESEGMASTLVAAFLAENVAHIAHLGDSRAYLIRKGAITRLTKDHSQVQELLDAGEITPEEAVGYPGRNVITRAIGAFGDVEVELGDHEVWGGDYILLCTDGLWDLVSDKEICEIVEKSSDPQAACNQLVSLANERGGKDNISVVIVRSELPKTESSG